AQGAPVFVRRPQVLREKHNLAGLWSSEYPRQVPSGKTGKAAVWDPDQKQWQDLTYVRLLEEIALWKGTDGIFRARPYRKLGPLWLAAPAETPPAGTWRVRTVQGEDLILNTAAPFTGRLSQELNAVWQGQPLRLPAADIAAIVRVQ